MWPACLHVVVQPCTRALPQSTARHSDQLLQPAGVVVAQSTRNRRRPRRRQTACAVLVVNCTQVLVLSQTYAVHGTRAMPCACGLRRHALGASPRPGVGATPAASASCSVKAPGGHGCAVHACQLLHHRSRPHMAMPQDICQSWVEGEGRGGAGGRRKVCSAAPASWPAASALLRARSRSRSRSRVVDGAVGLPLQQRSRLGLPRQCAVGGRRGGLRMHAMVPVCCKCGISTTQPLLCSLPPSPPSPHPLRPAPSYR